MSNWVEKFNSHPAIQSWATLIDTINNDKLDIDLSDDSIQDLARLKKVLTYLDGMLQNVDPELMPFSQLNNIRNAAQSCNNELNAFIGDRNTGRLQNANNQADSLQVILHQTPAAFYGVSSENIKASLNAYTETIDKFVSKTKKHSSERLETFSKTLSDLDLVIAEKQKKLDNLNSQIENVEQTIQKQTSEFNTQFQNSENIRAEKFEKSLTKHEEELNGAINHFSNKADNEFEKLVKKTSAIIQVLTRLKDEASQVYGVTINTLQSGVYSSYANEEKRSANGYRILASLLMTIGSAVLITPELMTLFGDTPYTFDWSKALSRVPVSLVIFVPAFYFAKESGRHRHNEVSNRRRQHILSTLDPYVELMDHEKAEELRVHVAKTVFSEDISEEKGKKDTSHLITQISNLVKQVRGGQ